MLNKNKSGLQISINNRSIAKNQKSYAKAIYDNIADSPDELAFKKGDILNIIEQDTDGLQGWWLCSVQKPGGYILQGICPGNRLRIINSYDSGCFSPSSLSSSPSPSLGSSTVTLNSSILSSSEIYENSGVQSIQNLYQYNNIYRQGKRRSWNASPHKVITPHKCGDVYLYDFLPLTHQQKKSINNLTIMSDSSENYDIPKPSTPTITSQLRSLTSSISRSESIAEQQENYDIPKPISIMHQQNMTPSSSNSSIMTSDSISLPSNRSSLLMPDYDIPKKNPQSIRNKSHPHIIHEQVSYDFPQQRRTPIEKSTSPLVIKELPLELNSALETLNSMQTELGTAITKILAFVAPDWRYRQNLETILMDFKLCVTRLKTALHDLAEFAGGALGNASKVDDKNLTIKLKPLVKALQNHSRIIEESFQDLDMKDWNLDVISRENLNINYPPDSLDQLIACAQTLTEDVRSCASYIFGNSKLLFKRMPATPTTPSDLQDYDYVSFESKDSAAKKNADLRDTMPQGMQAKFDLINQFATNLQTSDEKLDVNDKLLVTYYSAQICTHITYLTQAIDNFLETVEKNQAPKYFLAYGKFVILSAHNLVSIGDIVHRNLQKEHYKIRIQECTDSLNEALRNCVNKSKKASQNFPQVDAVQQMVDSVVDISHIASDLKISMLQCVHVG